MDRLRLVGSVSRGAGRSCGPPKSGVGIASSSSINIIIARISNVNLYRIHVLLAYFRSSTFRVGLLLRSSRVRSYAADGHSRILIGRKLNAKDDGLCHPGLRLCIPARRRCLRSYAYEPTYTPKTTGISFTVGTAKPTSTASTASTSPSDI